MDKELSSQIENFWDWFKANLTTITEVIQGNHHPKTEWLIEQLDQHILGMGTLKWELGNPQPHQFSLLLSPNAKSELLLITKQIVAAAPILEGWNFYPSVQKSNEVSIAIYDNDMEIVNIDSTLWQAALTKTPDGRYELTIDATKGIMLDEDTRQVAANILLNHIIGEESKITHLVGFKFIDANKSDNKTNWFPLTNLSSHLTF